MLRQSLSDVIPLVCNDGTSVCTSRGGKPGIQRDGGHKRGPRWASVAILGTISTRRWQGRAIDERDTPAATHVAVINDTFARRFFPNENPIGQHFGMGDVHHSDDYEIVGIVEAAKYQDTRGPAYATFFLPLLQVPSGEPLRGWVSAIEFHVAGRPENIEPAVRQSIAGGYAWQCGAAELQSHDFHRRRVLASRWLSTSIRNASLLVLRSCSACWR